MKALVICAAVCAAAFAQPQQRGLPAPERAAIERAVLEVNAQMTRAAEDRDIDRLFSFMLANDRGSIIQSGNLFLTREEASDTVKRGFEGIAAIKYRWKRQLVTVISPTTALLVCDGESEVRTAQEPPATFVRPFAQSVLFVLTDGKWKALHAHMSSVPRGGVSAALVGQDGILRRVANPPVAPVGNRRAACQAAPQRNTFSGLHLRYFALSRLAKRR